MWVPLIIKFTPAVVSHVLPYRSYNYSGCSFREFVFTPIWGNDPIRPAFCLSKGWLNHQLLVRRYLVCKCWYYTFRILSQGYLCFPLEDELCKIEAFWGALKFMEELDGNKNPNILTRKTQKVCWYICLNMHNMCFLDLLVKCSVSFQ